MSQGSAKEHQEGQENTGGEASQGGITYSNSKEYQRVV